MELSIHNVIATTSEVREFDNFIVFKLDMDTKSEYQEHTENPKISIYFDKEHFAKFATTICESLRESASNTDEA